MKYTKTISPELKDILKSCTSVEQRKQVASKHEISIHTLNSVIEGNRKVNLNNQNCITDLLRISIVNARNMHYSLLDYYQELKQL
jgi:hypothetical protein